MLTIVLKFNANPLFGVFMIVECLGCHVFFNKKAAEVKRTKNNYCSKKCKGDYLSAQSKISFFTKTKNNGDCIEWAGAINSSGYGVCRYEKKPTLAHRAAYMISGGKLADFECVCHKCDNPKCVNPEHLFAASHSVNMEDMRSKMRKWSKLSFDDVSEIRASSCTSKELALKYGVSDRAIRYARDLKNWMPLRIPPPPSE